MIPLVLLAPTLAALAPMGAAALAQAGDAAAVGWSKAGSPGGGRVQGIGGDTCVFEFANGVAYRFPLYEGGSGRTLCTGGTAGDTCAPTLP